MTVRTLVTAIACSVLVACSSPPDAPETVPGARDAAPTRTGERGRTARPDAGVASPSVARSDDDATTRDGDGGDSEVAGDGSTGEDDRSSALFPAAGSYAYSQSGYEEFCQAATCDRQDLPARQPVAVSHAATGPDSGVVVTEIEASDNRLLRTRTRYDRAHALVTKVYVRFAYEGFTFEETYTPKPPVDSLRFPLRRGAAWSGSWRDSTSGDYRVEVFAPSSVDVGGRSVRAFRVQTFTAFRGQFSGRSKIDTWIDPATKAIVRTRGVLNVTSAFGRYSTSFATRLRSGPDYR
ncbi:MAG: hypothetical protein M3238_08215 [Actinomycetota bacterium]|nr:hypothetical protein [Actinomycetota bacterium]